MATDPKGLFLPSGQQIGKKVAVAGIYRRVIRIYLIKIFHFYMNEMNILRFPPRKSQNLMVLSIDLFFCICYSIITNQTKEEST